MYCPNPVAFTVFGHEIYWYGVFMSLSVILAVVLAYLEARKKGIDLDTMLDYALLTVPVAIVFARLYYVVFEWEQYADNPISVLYIWQGGIGIYGGVIFAFLSGLIMCRICKLDYLKMCDLASLGFLIGQGIGRWGNFFNQEAFGGNTDLPWGMTGDIIAAGTNGTGSVQISFICEGITLHEFLEDVGRPDAKKVTYYGDVITFKGAEKYHTPMSCTIEGDLLKSDDVLIGWVCNKKDVLFDSDTYVGVFAGATIIDVVSNCSVSKIVIE